jgi:hypothetical protein
MINNRHIWEGWMVQDFIDELEPTFNQIIDNSKRFGTKSFETTEQIKIWCMDNQPYYKKYIPEVVNYFKNKLKLN